MQFFAGINASAFEASLTQMLGIRKSMWQVTDLQKWDGVEGVYVMVLDANKQAYVGASTDLRRRVRSQWTGAKQFDRLLWGSVGESILSIDSLRALDTTRLYAARTTNHLPARGQARAGTPPRQPPQPHRRRRDHRPSVALCRPGDSAPGASSGAVIARRTRLMSLPRGERRRLCTPWPTVTDSGCQKSRAGYGPYVLQGAMNGASASCVIVGSGGIDSALASRAKRSANADAQVSHASAPTDDADERNAVTNAFFRMRWRVAQL